MRSSCALSLAVVALVAGSALLASCTSTPATTTSASGPQTTAGADLKLGPDVTRMAANPTPPASARPATTIGRGALTISTANSPNDSDWFWVEQIDIDGDGTINTVDVLWDDEDRVLYLFGEEDFLCRNGGVATAGVLIGLNSTGNPRNRPVGSGFYVVGLDALECGAQAAALWGCRFEANGNATDCGWVTIDAANDTIVVARAAVR